MKLSPELREYLRELGKLGGRSKSDKKLAAVRANQLKAAAARRKPTENNIPAELSVK